MSDTRTHTGCLSGRSLLTLDDALAQTIATVDWSVSDEVVGLGDTLGRVLASDIFSQVPLPPFDHSAMDGYAVRTLDFGGIIPLTMPVGMLSAAGSTIDGTLAPASVARILTGAPLPNGADAVVMQERCFREGNVVTFCELPARGDNIRRRGEDVRAGERVIVAGTRLDARHIAALAAMGIDRVAVRRKLRVTLISTGSELTEPGHPLGIGQIHDSNGPMLAAVLARPDVHCATMRSSDHLGILTNQLVATARISDLVVTTGGASDGDADFTASAVREAGGVCHQLRVALKPGKPSVVGRLGQAAFLGLPGNPVSALVNFLLLGDAVMRRLQAREAVRPRGLPACLQGSYRHPSGRTEFMPARILTEVGSPLTVETVGRGGSARLKPLLAADGLVEIGDNQGDLESGSIVRFHPFVAFGIQ